jgi:hypothetical protein
MQGSFAFKSEPKQRLELPLRMGRTPENTQDPVSECRLRRPFHRRGTCMGEVAILSGRRVGGSSLWGRILAVDTSNTRLYHPMA